jgi:hypothetical protein
MQRGRRRGSGSALLLTGIAAVLVAIALPAWGARVLDVRTGQHPGYSRVVFELDSPVGYKVERSNPETGGSELIVSLDALAEARTISSAKGFISQIVIKSDGRRSTARMSLVGSGLKLKEMILANPPRIVLDVLDESAQKAAAPAVKVVEPPKVVEAKAPKAATGEPPKPAPTRAEPVRAEPPKPEPAVVSGGSLPQRGAMDGIQPPASVPDAGSDAPSVPTQIAMNKPSVSPSAPATAPGPAPTAPAVRPPAATPVSPAVNPAPKPAVTARPATTPRVPAVVVPAEQGLASPKNLALGAVAVVLLAGAGFVVWRRRGAAEVMDASEFENVNADDNPFAAYGADTLGDDDEIVAPSFASGEAATEGIEIDEDEARSSRTEGADMQMATDGNATTIMTPPPVRGSHAGASHAAGDDVSRMIAEFERRMAGMETRIDELVDAKERLERQVAAQTEELRVQRAAIARTQRAVRNLNRPGDDAPTEPALRDPTRPEGPRE